MTDSQHPIDQPSTSQVPPEIRDAPPIGVTGDIAGDVVPTAAHEFSSFHSEFASFHEGYVRSNIAFADTKAAWTFAVASGLLIFLFGNDAILLLLRHPNGSATFLLLLAVVVLLTLSAFFSFFVIAPRLANSGEGFVYFGAVAARRNAEAYVRDIARAKEADLVRARISHCFDLSLICARKYKRLNTAIYLGVAALVGFLVLLLVL